MDIKPKIVLAPNVWKQIKWLTRNCETEIGAVGTVQIKQEEFKNGEDEYQHAYFYVDKLFFPEQTVSGCTVNIKPNAWVDIHKDVHDTENTNIAFYWHRHPNGSAAHSHTDEEKTFEVFMSPTSKKRYFCFLQTSEGSDGKIIYEARLETKIPVRATIKHPDVALVYEKETEPEEKELPEGEKAPELFNKTWEALTSELNVGELDDDDLSKIKEKLMGDWNNLKSNMELQKECTAIIKEKVKEEVIAVTHYNYGNNGRFHRNYNYAKKDTNAWGNLQALQKLFGTVEDTKESGYIDNDILNGMATSSEEKASLRYKNGQIVVTAGELFQKVLSKTLKKLPFTKLIRRQDMEETNGITTWKLQPSKKSFAKLRESLNKLFMEFNRTILSEITESTITSLEDFIEQSEEEGDWDENRGIQRYDDFHGQCGYDRDYYPPSNRALGYGTSEMEEHTVTGGIKIINQVFAELEAIGNIEWSSDGYGEVFVDDGDDEVLAGTLIMNDNEELLVEGTELVNIIKPIEKVLKEAQTRLLTKKTKGGKKKNVKRTKSK